MLIDSHAHLDFKDFQNDIASILHRTQEAGVKKIITVGYNIESSKKAVEIANTHEQIWATVGIHPYDVKTSINLDKDMSQLEKLITNHSKICAFGECGLDYHYDNIDKAKQEIYFRNQIQLAKKHHLPLVIHSRDAEKDTINILSEEKPDKVVMHCFPGGKEYTKKCLKLGYYLSFTGNVTYKNAQKVHEAVMESPIDTIMIETDCPFLAPQKYRGKRNEPAFLPEIAKRIAELKGVSYDTIARKTTENAERFYGI